MIIHSCFLLINLISYYKNIFYHNNDVCLGVCMFVFMRIVSMRLLFMQIVSMRCFLCRLLVWHGFLCKLLV